jgi:hypothetical protein
MLGKGSTTELCPQPISYSFIHCCIPSALSKVGLNQCSLNEGGGQLK